VSNQRSELIHNFREKVKAANKEFTKKEAFKDLLNRLYSGNKSIEQIIDKITQGSETTVLNIPRKDKLHKGSADTLYNKIIIEFENDLRASLPHAKEQLAGYLLGQFNSGEGYNFTLIVSDCIHWKVFAPDISQIEHLEKLKEHELILNEIESTSFSLDENNAEDFYFWLDRFLFKEEKQRATLKRIEESFGNQSNVFIESFRELDKQFNEVKKFGEVQVSFEQWNKFLSIAYGAFDGSDSNFLIHTYLSIFSKMLAYAAVSNDDFIDDVELKGIIKGDIFDKYNIKNFIDNDFFHWVGNDKSFRGLKKVFRLIAQEISAFDFNEVDEDILKGVYQELIDLDTRHALGEYYTPDWLCERVVNEYHFTATDKILDPACGSGSFLRAAIQRIKQLNPEITVEEIVNNVYGIDIHPLSVQIAKTNILIALGKELRKGKLPVHINIILANSLIAPEGASDLFGNDFVLTIDRKKLLLSTQILDDNELFNTAVEICNDMAEEVLHKAPESEQTLINVIRIHTNNYRFNGNISESFYKIYLALKEVKEKGRDSIWGFIIKNLYKPYFLSKRFQYVIGNPPWFTYSSIKNEEYQNLLLSLATKYKVKPNSVANLPHLEIAAIFMSYCSSYFLKEQGKMAFVLPRSFFSADHHDNTRSGAAEGFRLTQIWDLNDVSPLFRIPSCAFFAEKADNKRALPAGGIAGITFSGNLPYHNCKLEKALPKLTETPTVWFYAKQGSSTAFSTRQIKIQNEVNPYKNLFKQGATIVPRAFYFVQLTQDEPNWQALNTHIKSLEDIQADAKAPWKSLKFHGKIESNFVFRTALSRSILPFALYKPDLVILPIFIEKDEQNQKRIQICTARELLLKGYRDANKWFTNVERIWDQLKTEKSKNMSSNDRIDFQKGLSSQNLNAPYLVLYNSSAKDANATVVKRADYDLEFIVESVTYVLYCTSLFEAFYLSAILNSTRPNQMMKDFQAKGLFGPRHVHKKILDIYYPKFNAKNKTHVRLAELSEKAHQKATLFLEKLSANQKFDALKLGRIRLEIKKHIIDEMNEIDKLVDKIIA